MNSEKSILIQFHSTRKELFSFVWGIVQQYNLNSAIVTWKEFSFFPIETKRDLDQFLNLSDRISIILSSDRVDSNFNHINKFFDGNSDLICFDSGLETKYFLNESGYECRTNRQDRIILARKIAGKLKKITQRGAVEFNPETGASGNIVSHRYTAEAKELYEKGCSIKPIAGSNLYKLSPDKIAH